MKTTAVTITAVAFLAVFIACITTALLAMIAFEIRDCNHDKRQEDDGQEDDADEVHKVNYKMKSEK